MRCIFSTLADLDLEEIGDYIARDNPRRALSFIGEIRERCTKICHYPENAPLRAEFGEGVRMIPIGRYLIFYTIHLDEVRIERILSGSRNLPDLFGGLPE